MGSKLVVLDDIVLDVSSYVKGHPGGQEVIERNIGRDVSKYFYGGYAMSGHQKQPYAHTKDAMKVARVQLAKYRLSTGLGLQEAETYKACSLTSSK
jgi:cytochrome b involved in lipid metabolism